MMKGGGGGEGGDHLKFAAPQGGITKILLIQQRDHQQFTKNLKFPEDPKFEK